MASAKQVRSSNTCEDDDTLEPYADEPIADEEWLKRYRKEQEEKRRLEEDLTKRLENRVRVSHLAFCIRALHYHLSKLWPSTHIHSNELFSM